MNEWMNFIQKIPGWHSSICTLCYINGECFCWWNTDEKLLVVLTATSCYRKVPTGKTQQKALWGDSHSYLLCHWGLTESACFWTKMFGSVFGESRGRFRMSWECVKRFLWPHPSCLNFSHRFLKNSFQNTEVNFFRRHQNASYQHINIKPLVVGFACFTISFYK